MLDIQFIRDNADFVQEKSNQKGIQVDIVGLLQLDSERRAKLGEVEDLRRRRNEQADSLKGGQPTEEQIAAGRQLKEELSKLEADLGVIEDTYTALLKRVPNMPWEDVPVGASEEENVVVKEWGAKPEFDFEPKNHWEIAEARDLIDKDRAAKISGSRFAYIKGGLVELQFGIIQWVISTLGDEEILQKIIADNHLEVSAKPFTPVLPPVIVRTAAYDATGRLDAEETTYRLANDDSWLVASAEHSLCNMYMNEVLPEDMLPIRYIGYSTSFRREAGTYGKDMEGIIRQHQFDKLEMESFSTGETGLQEHLLLVAIQEYLVQQLGLPYHVLQKCTYDIGKPNARGIDLEVWLPGQNAYRETHTADYMTDYQARSLKTRVKRKDSTIQLVHTNDATAFALGRIMVAIMENFQQHDGTIQIPEVLQPFMGEKTTI